MLKAENIDYAEPISQSIFNEASLSNTLASSLRKAQESFSFSGKKIKCEIDSVCIHGDNKESLQTAKQIKKVLEENNIYLKPLDKLKKFL